MEIDLALQNEIEEFDNIYEDKYITIVKETCQQVGIQEDIELSCVFVNNNEIQKMNKEYRNIDAATDVISFALEDIEPLVLEGQPRCLGDIFISVERAKEQAKEYQHSIEREMCFLFTHGVLHLLGYDHMEEDDEKEMITLQKSILKAVGMER